MQALEKITYSNNWVTAILLLLFLSIVVLKLLDAKRLKESFFALINFTFIEDKDIERNSFFDVFQIVIFLFSVTVLSLLTYNFLTFKIPEVIDSFSNFWAVFVNLFLYFLIKRILEFALSHLFMIRNRIHFFITSKANYLYSLSFLSYITLILCEYSNLKQLYAFYFIGFLFIVRFIFYSIRNKKLVFNKLFYFILYICTLEIAPLFVLFKLMF